MVDFPAVVQQPIGQQILAGGCNVCSARFAVGVGVKPNITLALARSERLTVSMASVTVCVLTLCAGVPIDAVGAHA
jgi:hypothetical protein